jgi:hypothetical protein
MSTLDLHFSLVQGTMRSSQGYTGCLRSIPGLLGALVLLTLAPAGLGQPLDQATVILVVGAPGEPAYGRDFARAAERWQAGCEQADAELYQVGLTMDAKDDQTDLSRLREFVIGQSHPSPAPLWIVFIGHGTFDGRDARFNLRGPDVTAAQLAEWLLPAQRPIAVIQGASASGPFLQALSGPNRVVVTATNSGYEQNYARFGLFFAEAIANPQADLDKDGQVSLLEAFLVAARHVAEFYETEGRLATEHALLDDNGDGRGTPADWFDGLRVTRQSADGSLPDGFRARQWHLVPNALERLIPIELRQRRDQIELDLAQLRELKPGMDEELYYEQLETFLLELSRLYESLDLLPPRAATP